MPPQDYSSVPAIVGEAFSRASTFVDLVIPAGGVGAVPAYGQAFYIIACAGQVYIKTDETSEKPYARGTGEEFPEALRFKRLEIRNPSASDLAITIWCGFGKYIDNRAEVLEGWTEAAGWNGSTIAANSGVTFHGAASGKRRQRRALYISNMDPNASIQLRDTSGNVVAIVFAQSSAVIPVAGDVQVYNNNPSAISVSIGETWYTDQ